MFQAQDSSPLQSGRPVSRPRPCVRRLGPTDYVATWRAMQAFTAARTATTLDELWCTEHPPVYTVGLNGKPEHFVDHDPRIPVIQVDRGGQVTYHGPGQAVIYLLLDLRRLGWSVRELVRAMEQAVVELLAEHGVTAHGDVAAPGVYVNDAKIAALGLRIKNGCSYHGLACNVAMDLSPFATINPCGQRDLPVTQAADWGIALSPAEWAEAIAERLITLLYVQD